MAGVNPAYFPRCSPILLDRFLVVPYCCLMAQTKDPEDVRVGATLRALRKAHGLRLGEMAAALGISHAYLSNVEAGRKSAPLLLCRKAAALMRVPLAAITIEDYEGLREAARQAKAAEKAEAAA